MVRCLLLEVVAVSVRGRRFDVVVGESVVFWLFNELLDEVTETCRDRLGDEHLDEDWLTLLFKSATRLFLIKGVVDVIFSVLFLLLSVLLWLLLLAPLL
jgi:hypothetical protein